jgi:hypothetical protein
MVRSVHDVTPLPPASPLTVDVPVDRLALVALRGEARRLDMPVARLASDLLEAIGRRGLTAMILSR